MKICKCFEFKYFFLHREKKIEGLNFVRCLSAYHAAILTAKLHETSLAVAQEVKFYYQNISLSVYVFYSSQIH